MKSVFFRTKIIPPILSVRLLERKSLVERIRSGLDKKLSLILAPAGFGKTTLIAQSVHGIKRSVFWYSVSEAENEVFTFLRYFVAAFHPAETGFGRSALLMCESPTQVMPDEVIANLLNDIYRFRGKIVFVLDDFQSIQNQKVFQLVDLFLSNIPSNVHLIVISRIDPPLSLSRLRGQGKVNEIRVNDLRFTSNEINQFIHESTEVSLTENELYYLNEKLDGWIAGIQLLLLALHGSPKPTGIIQGLSSTNEYIADYFLDEVLEKLPKKVKEFLFHTSFLQEFTPTLTDVVLKINDSHILINEIMAHNAFLNCIDHHNKVYQYHPLFKELLLQRFKTQEPVQLLEFQKKAIHWYERECFSIKAIDLALEAGEYKLALECMERCADYFWEQGDQMRLLWWFEKMDREIKVMGNQIPEELLVHFVRVLMLSGRIDTANRLLQRVSSKNISPTTTLKKWILEGSLQFHHGNPSEALSILAQIEVDGFTIHPLWRISFELIKGVCLSWQGNLHDGAMAFEQAFVLGKELNHPYSQAETGFRLASNYLQMAQFQRAYEISQQCIDLAEQAHLDNTALLGGFYAIQSTVLIEWDRIEDGFSCISKSIPFIRGSENIPIVGYVYLTLLRCLFLSGEYAEANRIIREVGSRFQDNEMPRWLASSLLKYRIFMKLINRNYSEAYQLLRSRGLFEEEAINLTKFDEYYSVSIYDYIIGVINKDHSSVEHGLNLLEKLINLVSQHDLPVKQKQLAYLKFNYIRNAMVGEGKHLGWLSPQSEVNDLGDVRVLELDNLFSETLPRFSNAESIVRGSSRVMMGFLTPREVEILYLLPSSLTTVEMADRLVISASTVRSHIKSIYRKLEVHTRMGAVEKARMLELIQ